MSENEINLNTIATMSRSEFLDKISNFDNQLEFVSNLLNKYEWDYDTKTKLKSMLDLIKVKQDDKLLNLSVIGEFSTGKSSLINAMIRSDLLTSSDLQGTTVASVTINYSKDYSIEIFYEDGKKEVKKYNSFEELRDALPQFAVNTSTIAQKISRVVVNFPAENLENRFRIIDTPGTNATENWHEGVTIYTIQEVSDVSLIVVDATKPLPDTLCQFVLSYLKKVLPQCVFVVTKMDLLRRKERERMLQYIKSKIEATFEITNPLVLPYIATEVIKSINKEEDIDENLLNESIGNEEKLIEYMMNRRIISQSKKIVELADQIYTSMSEKMADISQDYENKLNKLLKSKQADLTSFVREQKRARKEEFKDWSMMGREYFKNNFFTLSEQAYNFIIEKISYINDIQVLNDYCKFNLSNDIVGASKIIIDNAGDFQAAFAQGFSAEIMAFQTDFEKLFKDLDILQIRLERKEYKQPLISTYNSDISSVSSFISSEIKKGEDNANTASKIAGVAGWVLLGPLGGIVGAIGGSILGGKFGGPNIQQLKADVLGKLSNPLRTKFNEVAQDLCHTVEKCINNFSDSIDSEIDRYLKAYQTTVDEKIQEQRMKKIEIEHKIAEIQSDLNDIDDRKDLLFKVNRQLDRIN